jgi:hypothetical protein
MVFVKKKLISAVWYQTTKCCFHKILKNIYVTNKHVVVALTWSPCALKSSDIVSMISTRWGSERATQQKSFKRQANRLPEMITEAVPAAQRKECWHQIRRQELTVLGLIIVFSLLVFIFSNQQRFSFVHLKSTKNLICR